MRERGLKLIKPGKVFRNRPVAPRAGAWIETPSWVAGRILDVSLPVRERGLKLYNRHKKAIGFGRSPCGSVD